MRIRTEKIDLSTGYYRMMPEKQRRFFLEPESITYEHGNHWVSYHPNARNVMIKIGFDKDGKLYLEPRINTKSGKASMSGEELKALFDMIIAFLDSASKNGFLEVEAAEEKYEIGAKAKAIKITAPHGRLIDADALLSLLDKCMFPSDMVTTTAVRMAENWIKEAPTVIEAEEDA